MHLIKPKKLSPGDKIATVSLSWGGAGDEEFLWRYNLGKKRLEEKFNLEVVEMENTLKGSAYLYNHPEKRAEDLMKAFQDPTIKGIFTCIGGDESVRMSPYIDFEVIRNNIFAKPYNNQYYKEYKAVIHKVINQELKLVDLPILYNMNFGHTAPMVILPYGAKAEINCEEVSFRILDAAVL